MQIVLIFYSIIKFSFLSDMMNTGPKKCVIVLKLRVLQENILHFLAVTNVIGKRDGKIVLTETTHPTVPWSVIKKERWQLLQKILVAGSAIPLRNGRAFG